MTAPLPMRLVFNCAPSEAQEGAFPSPVVQPVAPRVYAPVASPAFAEHERLGQALLGS
ncbi:hypothetical protein [Sorangium sp. So ce590]|uniref:hypothetical protein n=1 Tax=unclassified Sorangium TaxID=2621164 RepID=UPI003F5FD7C3